MKNPAYNQKTCSEDCRGTYKWRVRTMGKHHDRSTSGERPSFKPEDWTAILNRHGRRCAYCNTKKGKMTMDHVLPLSRGGRHCVSNVVPACGQCNKVKADMTLMEWKRKNMYDLRPWTMTTNGIKLKRKDKFRILNKTPIFEQMMKEMSDRALLEKYPLTIDFEDILV
jgi:5-methylcytosine-specific restriction endonuclease McrA